MSWHKLNWLQFEAEVYSIDLERRVRDVYQAARTVLEKAHSTQNEEFKDQFAAATNEHGVDEVFDMQMLEEDRWLEQQRALAAMSLTVLNSRTLSFLDEVKKYFSKTHPPTKKKYDHGELPSRIEEYKDRFKIDLETITEFATVREVSLARNCCVHSECNPSQDYRRQCDQRLVDKCDKINLTPDHLDALIRELKRFAEKVVQHLENVKDKRQATTT